jgi:hypothetical protein
MYEYTAFFLVILCQTAHYFCEIAHNPSTRFIPRVALGMNRVDDVEYPVRIAILIEPGMR